MIHLRTDRWHLRLWEEPDFPVLASFFADPEETKFLGGQKNEEEAWRLMATYLGHYHIRGYSYLAIVDNTDSRLLGGVGIWNSEPWPEPEMGYWLLPEARGKGIITEAAGLLKSFAFRELHFPTLVSFIHPENAPSKRVAGNLGASFESTIQLLDFGQIGLWRYPAESF